MVQIQNILENNNWNILPSPDDGHCLLHSTVSSYNNQLNRQIDIHNVKCRFFIESVINFMEYLPFLDITSETYFTSLRKYLLEKHYNLELVDAAPLILANAFGININILNERPTLAVDRINIASRSQAVNTITVHRKGDHYNAIENKSAAILNHVNRRNASSATTCITYSSAKLKQIAAEANPRIAREVRKTLFRYKLWRPRLLKPKDYSNSALHTIQCAPSVTCTPHEKFSMCHLNARSVNNKTHSLRDFITTNDLDLIAITETWLGRDTDDTVIAELLPPTYDLLHIPRPNGRTGGGVGVIYKKNISLRLHHEVDHYTQFEHLECTMFAAEARLHLFIVYRPPPSTNNGLSHNAFLDEWTSFMQKCTKISSEIIILGDINVHMDDRSDPYTRRMNDLLQEYGFHQHVQTQTHVKGHILDVVITRDTSNILQQIEVADPYLCNNSNEIVHDHFAVFAKIQVAKPKPKHKTVTFRKYGSVDIVKFKQSILESQHQYELLDSADNLTNFYNSFLTDLVNEHAPLISKTTMVRPQASWWTSDLTEAKRERRRLERIWRRSKTYNNHQKYKAQCSSMNELIQKTRTSYYNEKLLDCGRDQKEIFKLANHLLGRNKSSPLPSSESDSDLAERFSTFFSDKVATIITKLMDITPSVGINFNLQVKCGNLFDTFKQTDNKDIINLIQKASSKSCPLDPLPTHMVKKCSVELAPIICKIINSSLTEGHVPEVLKVANITPLLKKPGFNTEVLKNFRPVSNLSFVSKLLEKVVAKQLDDHLTTSCHNERFQSAYKKHHSTETAIVKVQADISLALDRGSIAVLVLLDMSAAFDTVSHKILLDRMNTNFGVGGKVLTWFESYLSNRKQQVVINGSKSGGLQLRCGVPQGSVLGPKLFSMYTSPLGRIIENHGFQYHIYADDTQIYIAIEMDEDHEVIARRIENCIKDLKYWLATNMLQFNGDKSELIIFAPKSKLPLANNISIEIDGSVLKSKNVVRNLGVQLDQTLKMEKHINQISKSCVYQLRNICRIRNSLTFESAKSFVHALVISRLDYANSALCGVSTLLLTKLQKIQNFAARVISGASRRDHISPVLMDLHWLPIKQRIQYKVLVLTYQMIHGLAPSYLCDLVSVYTPRRTLRSKDSLTLCPPKTRTVTYGDKSFVSTACALWNKLPLSLRQINALFHFKGALKTHLFKEAFY
jgi:exonuclease III